MSTKNERRLSSPGRHPPFKCLEKRCHVLPILVSITSDATAKLPVSDLLIGGLQYHMSKGAIGYCGGMRTINSVVPGLKPPPDTSKLRMIKQPCPSWSGSNTQSYWRSLRNAWSREGSSISAHPRVDSGRGGVKVRSGLQFVEVFGLDQDIVTVTVNL